MLRALLMLCFISFAFPSIAQDTIYTRTNQQIIAKVLEIGTKEVRYKRWDLPSGPDYVLPKNDILKIVLSNGEVEEFEIVVEVVTPPPYGGRPQPFGDMPVRTRFANGFGVQLVGPAFLSVEYDRYVANILNFEIGVGLGGAYVGAGWHILGDDPYYRWTPTLGVQVGGMTDFDLSLKFNDYSLYVPIGFNFAGYNGLQFSVDVGPLKINGPGDLIPFGSIKVGARF